MLADRAWARGDRAVRRHRGALQDELASKLGPRRAEGACCLLVDVAAELGANPAVRGRRPRPPR